MTTTLRCHACGSTAFDLGREHTVWEIRHVQMTDAGVFAEVEPSDFGDTLSTGAWEELTCAECQTALDPALASTIVLDA